MERNETCECGMTMPFGNAYCGLCAVENFKAALTKPEEKGGVNDFWHVAQRHKAEEDDPSGDYFEVVNYARHERIYMHETTEARAEQLCKSLNGLKF